jgi:hypothetical protein
MTDQIVAQLSRSAAREAANRFTALLGALDAGENTARVEERGDDVLVIASARDEYGSRRKSGSRAMSRALALFGQGEA